MVDDDSNPGPFGLTDLIAVAHVVYADAPGWLVAVQFQFVEGFLSIEADPDHDSVDVAFSPTQPPAATHWFGTSTTNDASKLYTEVLGLSSSFRWVLRNQHGYSDGFQIELGPADSTVTLQYLATASRLHPRRVTETSIV